MRSTLSFSIRTWPLALTLAAGLGGCGGDDDSSVPAPAPAPTSVTISGVVADGPLQGATACYDLNDNGACDSGEPSATTDAAGAYSLAVDIPAAGLHRVVVQVPATAIDKDTGTAVGQAYVLVSPATANTATQTVFVSPLTTLVQAQIDATGDNLTDATAYVQAQAALALSPLTDFTAATSSGASQAAGVARVLGSALLQQATAVNGVVGQVDVSGSAVTQPELDAAVRLALLGMLPALAAAAADPSISAAASADQPAAIAAVAETVVASQGLTTTSALAAVGVSKLTPDTSAPGTPAAGATLRALTFTDANNWYYRAMEATAADNTPDANGLLRYYDYRSQDVAGTVSTWGTGVTPDRAGDQHWNGSAWVACPLGTRGTNSPRDALGHNSYNFCDSLELGVSSRSGVDIGSQTLASVLQTIRAFPGGDSGVAFANWGPFDLSVFGSATFPAGATLFYYTNTPQQTAFAYDVRSSNVVNVFGADVAAGGDARNGSVVACAAVTSSNTASFVTPATSLEDLVARNPGAPCVFAQSTNSSGTSLDPNEWWGNSTVSLGIVGGALAAPSSYYNSNLSLRVGFAASGNGATYYNCFQRALDGSAGRNCTLAGTGTYAIQTLGDGRVLSFTGLPAAMQRTGYSRIFVERAGEVFFGYQSTTGAATSTVRLNLIAGNTLLQQLGLPPLVPTDAP